MQFRCKYTIALFMLLAFAGCGDDAMPSPVDASVDAGSMSSDAGPMQNDAGLPMRTPTPLAFDADNAQARTQLTDGNRSWVLRASDGSTQIAIELYEAYGAPTEPGTVALTEGETSYATCGTCVVLQTGCEAHGDHFHCDATFMPQAQGQLRIDTLGTSPDERLAGELQNIVFQQVSIAEDYATTPVADGELLRLDAWAFDAELEGRPRPEPECSGHGHQHGPECHCDPGYRTDPEDPTRCIPE